MYIQNEPTAAELAAAGMTQAQYDSQFTGGGLGAVRAGGNTGINPFAGTNLFSSANTGAASTFDINSMYQNALGRAPDAEGQSYWQGLLDSGTNPDDVRDAFNHGAIIELNNRAKQPAQPAFNPAATQFADPFKYDQKNPYLDQMADAATSQVTDNLKRNILPGISSAAMQAGGFGGSRQGVVEANALNDANKGLSDSITGMRYGDYNATMNRQLSKYGQDQSYNLGLGNLQLGNRNADMNQVQLGANLFQQSNQGMLNQGQGVYNLGLTAQQAPWQSMQGFTNASQPYTGFGSTTQNQTGSAGAGFLGGALTGAQAYNIYNNSKPTNNYGGGQGFGSGIFQP